MNTRGSIRSEEAYALGKMLDNSSWWTDEPKLPRKITPSDMDLPQIPLVFDNNGQILLCELSMVRTQWQEMSSGQRWIFESVLNHANHFAVLCSHNVKPEMGRRINTRYDIQSFQVMLWDFGIIHSKVVNGNGEWQNFVLQFYRPAMGEKIRRRIIGRSAEGSMTTNASNQRKTGYV